ncbi:MAG: hypothetical protein QW666_00675 [Candidatus Woesearchaeota archaeon]
MKKTITTLLIIAVLITSCQFMPVKKEQVKVTDIYVGTKGVTLDFLENAPPAEVYEESLFDIILKVHNQGANDVRGGMLAIGIEEQNVILEQRDARFDLAGKSSFNPEGTYEMKQFRATARKLGPYAGNNYPTTITATACYAYKTSATTLVCIDTDLLGVVKNKACKPMTQNYGSGQGAPVSVISVVPKMIPHTDKEKIIPEFIISIANPGGGNVVASEHIYDACTGKSIEPENWNKVKISAMLSDQMLTCVPDTIMMQAGENKAVCALPSGIDKALGTYTAPLSVELNYGYMKRIVKPITITRTMLELYR